MEKIKIYFISIMNDSRKGFFAWCLRKILWFFSLGYLLVTRARGFFYRSGIFKIRSVTIPVISVGNITVGGTGKTPFTMYLARLINRMGHEVAVVTRGYGSDEHIMLKEELPSAHVIVEPDRYKAALTAEKENCKAVILDDGYQHRRLGRDLDILLLDSGEKFSDGHVLPRGLLREPADAIKRADMVVITKCDKLSPAGLEALTADIRNFAPEIRVLNARHRPLKLSDLDGNSLETEYLAGREVALLSGIADPWYFEYMVKRTSAAVLWHKRFSDHHGYSASELGKLCRKAERDGAECLITTRKDMVKLRGLLGKSWAGKFYSLEVEMEIVRGEEVLIAGLDSIDIG